MKDEILWQTDQKITFLGLDGTPLRVPKDLNGDIADLPKQRTTLY